MNETPQDPQHPDETPRVEPTAAAGGSDQDAPTSEFGYTEPISSYPGQYVEPPNPTAGLTPETGPGHQPPAPQPGAGTPSAATPADPYRNGWYQSGHPAAQQAGHQAGPYQSAQPLDSGMGAGHHTPSGGAHSSTAYSQPPWALSHGVGATATKPRSKSLAAAALVGVLLVGAGAGVGGAALWTNSDASGNTNLTTVSKVADGGTPTVASGSVESVAAKVLPSVVMIEVSGSQESGSGSGIILSSDGEILTNNHVVEVAGQSGTITVDFNDGTRAKAKILGTDPLTDTALIKAEGVTGLTPATLGKSDDLKVGQQVVAIGSPYGLNATVTSGIVSALNRPVNVGSNAGNATVYPAIQTDAAINPGNSGGALVDMAGNVIGINSSIRTASDSSTSASGSIGLGFAIPMDEIVPIVDQMRNGETPTHARLGIGVADASASNTSTSVGAVVKSVTANSAAGKAGIATGDVITKVDNTRIEGADALVATIRSYRPGDTVTVTWTHNGKEQSAKVKLDSDNGEYTTSQNQQGQQEQPPSDPLGGTSPFGSDN